MKEDPYPTVSLSNTPTLVGMSKLYGSLIGSLDMNFWARRGFSERAHEKPSKTV